MSADIYWIITQCSSWLHFHVAASWCTCSTVCVITVLTDNLVPLHSLIASKLIYSMTGGIVEAGQTSLIC